MLHRYSVWAPEAERVDVHLGADASRIEPMSPDGNGWWALDVEPGDGRYAFSLDGGDPRPDPRGRRLPDGVHAASALVDPARFVWTDGDWKGRSLRGSVIYELHVGTFTEARTFDGAIERLDHLVELGVDVVELMPVASFPGRNGWGYDGVSLFSVHEPYGGPDGLNRFVDAAHARGLAVWLDVVYNHLGPVGNYLPQFGPYFTDRHQTPWGVAVNLDGPGSDEVRAYFTDNVRQWFLDYHLDGLRLDAVHALHDESATHLLEELAKLAEDIGEATGIPRVLVAESDRNDPRTVAPRGVGGAGGQGLDGQWADDVHHMLHVLLTGETQGYYADFADPQALPKTLTHSPFFHDGTFSTFRERRHGRPVEPHVTPGWRFVASLQTHDQIGNRATGERVGQLAGRGRAAIGAALLLTSPYTPMLFMGEEFDASTPWQYFTDHSEEWLAESIREGRQAEFAEHGWSGNVPDPQDPGTVETSTLNWADLDDPGRRELFDWYRTLLRLRKLIGPIRDAELGEGAVAREGDLLLVRRGLLEVLANLGAEPGRLTVPDGSELLVGYGQVGLTGSTVELGPHSVGLLRAPLPEITGELPRITD
ncbi:malto-oligosyltrehalose trehalohydrolase [Micropruina sonneratiae]|uniref:malto-oligosyltrehalose trehalohydrolase n=1 Tax=Micropruina sonneratiae TaxID=2986940 RepID=UPI002225CD07|nr:malto-oligosyltrehalose trehalohydrolase [Micropruina sp. KQZ13P-5]MCW3156814.1 malto-oligosyltrehalose trehalohydrolase [Micropruina sp. KQZ13P-5]